MSTTPRIGPRLIPVCLGVLALFLLRDVLFLGRSFFERDLVWVYFPMAEAFVRAIAEGALPLRDPTTGFGQPLMGNPNAQVLYPPTWLHLIFPPDQAFSLITLLHFLLGAAGACLLARRWSGSPWSGLFAGVAWMISGPFLSAVNVWHHFDGAMWMPGVLLAFDRLLERPVPSRMLVLGAAFGMQGLAGSADLCIATALLALLRLLCEGRELANAGPRRAFRLSLGSLVVAATLTAGVWMPAAEILQSSARSGLTRAERAEWSIHPTVAAEFLVPIQIGTLPMSPEARGTLTDGRQPFLKSLFLGPLVVPLLLAALLNASVPGRLRVFLALGIGVCVLGSMGRFTPVYDVLVTLVPPLRLCRYPAKGALPLSLLVSLLAALGVGSLSVDRSRRAALAASFAMSLLNVAIFLRTPAFVAELAGPSGAALALSWASRVQSGILLSAGVLAALGVAFAVRRPGMVRLSFVLGLGLTAWINREINPTVSREAIQFRPPYAGSFSSGEPGRLYVFDYLHYPARSGQIFNRTSLIVPGMSPGLDSASAFILVVRSALMAPAGGVWGIEYAWDYDLFGLQDLALRDVSREMRQFEGRPEFLRLLQAGNVTRVAALHTSSFADLALERSIPIPVPEPLSIFRVPDPLPRAYAVRGARRLSVPQAQAALFNSAFDFRREVGIQEGDGVDVPISTSFTSSVEITARRSDRVDLNASLSEPGHVVLVEGFLPGWRATLDGVDVPVRRANALFLAIPVPAGRHQIVFTYRPVAVVAGLWITALAALGLLIAFAGGGSRATR